MGNARIHWHKQQGRDQHKQVDSFVNKVRAHDVFKNNDQAPVGLFSSKHYVIYSACLSGRSYLAKSDRSLTECWLSCMQ